MTQFVLGKLLRSKPRLLLLWGFFAALVLTGCPDKDTATGPPQIDPQTASQAAMAEYDKNSDGKIDATELKASPALRNAGKRLDANADSSVSADELVQRMQAYEPMSRSIACMITVNKGRRPLAGVEVVFEPEPFMGESYPVFRGTTDESGTTTLLSDPLMPGLPLGFYRVRITGNGLPEKFNTKTLLGRELADDAPSTNLITFNL